MGGELMVRAAGPDDVEVVRRILDEASGWLHARGVEQWPVRWHDSWIRPAIEAGETFIAEDRDLAFGTITLQWSDELVWGRRPPDAGYVHRLAIRRANAGAGKTLLDWAATQVAAAGRSFLRLDCWSGNDRLRAYYEAAGFEYQGDTTESTWTVSRYERQVR